MVAREEAALQRELAAELEARRQGFSEQERVAAVLPVSQPRPLKKSMLMTRDTSRPNRGASLVKWGKRRQVRHRSLLLVSLWFSHGSSTGIFLKRLCLETVIVRTDGEPTICELAEELSDLLEQPTRTRTTFAHAPQSDGAVGINDETSDGTLCEFCTRSLRRWTVWSRVPTCSAHTSCVRSEFLLLTGAMWEPTPSPFGFGEQ